MAVVLLLFAGVTAFWALVACLVLAATLGRSGLSGQCHIYTLTPCEGTVPSTLSELAKIRTLSLTYRLRF